MRNLKRVLSLALALVMVLGMMVITTSAADFTDADEITNIEAVEVLAALGIVEGSNGEFNPTGTFTREAAAKLITYMKIGPKMAEKLAGTDVFSDVAANRWSAKYIGYCANLGYITGRGDGTFDPSGELTDIALGKLVLCAIGYDAAKYTGANWATAVTVDMLDAGLVDSVTGTAISREDACAMILTAMKYSETPKTYDVVKGTEKLGTFADLLEASLYAKLLDATVETSEPTDTLLAEVYGVTYDSDDTDKFGRPAVSYKKGNTINLVYAEDATVTYAGADWKDVSKLMEDYDFSKAETIYNGSTYADDYSDFYGKNGVTVEVYADKDDVVSKVIVTEGYVTEVKDVKTDEKTEITTVTLTIKEAGYYINNGAYKTIAITSEDKANYPLVKDFAKGDVFMGFYAQDWDKTCKLLKVDAVESVEGTVTSKSADATYNGWVKIDGEKYEFANEYSQAAVAAKSEGAFYLYNGYIVDFAAAKDAEVELQYAYVLAIAKETVKEDLFADDTTDIYHAKLLLTNGTIITVETTETGATKEGTIVSYADGTGKNEGKTVLTDAAKGWDGTFSIKKNTVVQSGIGGTMNNKTVLIVETLDKDGKSVYTVYTGVTNIPNLTAKRVAGIQDKGVWTVYFALKAELTTGGPATTKDVVYLGTVSDKIEEVVGDKVISYYTYNAIVNGEITTIDAAVNTLGGLYGELTLNDDGLVTEGKALAGDKIATFSDVEVADAAKDGVINSYIYDDATVVYEVAANGAISVSSIDAIEKGDKISGYTTNDILTVVIVK